LRAHDVRWVDEADGEDDVGVFGVGDELVASPGFHLRVKLAVGALGAAAVVGRECGDIADLVGDEGALGIQQWRGHGRLRVIDADRGRATVAALIEDLRGG
jgi:hypothetical protein